MVISISRPQRQTDPVVGPGAPTNGAIAQVFDAVNDIGAGVVEKVHDNPTYHALCRGDHYMRLAAAGGPPSHGKGTAGRECAWGEGVPVEGAGDADVRGW